MAFIDNDEAEIVRRQEEARAGADNDAGLSALVRRARRLPCQVALGLGQPRVGGDDDGSESGLKLPDELRGQGDFGDQNNGGTAGLDGITRQLEVEPGLAGSGHPLN